MEQKKRIFKIILLISIGILIGRLMINNDVNYQMIREEIFQREMGSVFAKEPKYINQRTFQLTHSDGSPAPLHIVKFECCTVGGMVKNGELYIGTLNNTYRRPIYATTSELVPVLEMSTVIHELVHLTTKHFATSSACIDVNNSFWQEKIAYNAEWLYRQMMMFDEDGYYKISK